MAANWKCEDCGEISFGGMPGVCLSCGGEDWDVMNEPRDDPAPPPTTTCIEHAYGTTTRLTFQIKVF